MDTTKTKSGSELSQGIQGLTRQDIAKLVGQQVRVFAGMVNNVESTNPQSTFISIAGKLERDQQSSNRYKVRANDNCIAGFGEWDVLSVERQDAQQEQRKGSTSEPTRVEAIIKLKLHDQLLEDRES